MATVRERGLVVPQGTQSHSKSRTCPRVGKQAARIQVTTWAEISLGRYFLFSSRLRNKPLATTAMRERPALLRLQRNTTSRSTQTPDGARSAGPLQRSTLGAYTGGDSEPLTPKGEKAYWRLGRCFGGPRWRGAGDEGLGGNTWASRIWKGGRRICMLFRLCPTSK